MNEKVTNIIQIDYSGVNRAAGVLSKAFQEDPVFSYFLPDANARKLKSHFILEMLLRYCVSNGEVYAISPGFEAVASVLPHNRVNMDLWNGLRSGGFSNIIHTGLASISRQLSVSDIMCSEHKKLAPYPHKYGYLIGVEPGLKGQGYGSAMHKFILAKTDKDGVPFYIDSTNGNNVAMQQHFGFKVLKKYSIPRTDINIWAMLREPKKS